LLTTFRRRSDDILWQLKQSKRPVVLTVKGWAATVVADSEAYQRLLGIAARVDTRERTRQGIGNARGEGGGRRRRSSTSLKPCLA